MPCLFVENDLLANASCSGAVRGALWSEQIWTKFEILRAETGFRRDAITVLYVVVNSIESIARLHARFLYQRTDAHKYLLRRAITNPDFPTGITSVWLKFQRNTRDSSLQIRIRDSSLSWSSGADSLRHVALYVITCRRQCATRRT